MAFSANARGAFAEELAQVDVEAALKLIEPITGASEFNRHLQNIAHELAPLDPDRAIAILANFKEPDPDRRPINGVRDAAVQRVCYRMIRVAPDKAEKLARTIEMESQRPYCLCLMVESLLKRKDVTDAARDRARRLHEEAWQMLADIRKNTDQSEVAWLYPSTIAAKLCGQTAVVAPEQLPHRIWQTIALRRLMVKAGSYGPAGFGCCSEMARMLATTDRQRAAQVAAWVPAGYVQYGGTAAGLIAELYPEQCEASLKLVDGSAANRLRLNFVKALLRTGDASKRARHHEMALWFPDDEDLGPID